MTTPTDDELLRLCKHSLTEFLSHKDIRVIQSALKSRLTAQSRDEVVEECAEMAQKFTFNDNTTIVNEGMYYTGWVDCAKWVAHCIRALKSPTK